MDYHPPLYIKIKTNDLGCSSLFVFLNLQYSIRILHCPNIERCPPDTFQQYIYIYMVIFLYLLIEIHIARSGLSRAYRCFIDHIDPTPSGWILDGKRIRYYTAFNTSAIHVDMSCPSHDAIAIPCQTSVN